jgi:hypothetical protein
MRPLLIVAMLLSLAWYGYHRGHKEPMTPADQPAHADA